MFADTKNAKIGRIVVALATISVINVLIWPKFSTELLLHDPSMLEVTLSVDSDPSVPRRVVDPLGFGIATG